MHGWDGGVGVAQNIVRNCEKKVKLLYKAVQ